MGGRCRPTARLLRCQMMSRRWLPRARCLWVVAIVLGWWFTAGISPTQPGVSAQATHTVRIATLAPRGTPLIDQLQRWDREIRQHTGGQVRLQIFAGGVAGDEGVVVRKMRDGQLDAAAVTTTGLGLIARSVLVLGAPGLITDYAELDHVRERLAPRFDRIFDEAGYRLLGWGDAGRIRIFSNRRVLQPQDLRAARPWVWRENPLMVEFVREAGANGVPMGLPEVYPALQTGQIDTVFSSALGVVGFQWFTRLRYMGGQSSGVVVGALVIKKETLERLPPGARDFLIRTAADFAGSSRLQALGRELDDRAFSSLQRRGVEVLDMQSHRGAWERTGRAVRERLAGRVYPRELLDEVESLVAEVRAR